MPLLNFIEPSDIANVTTGVPPGRAVRPATRRDLTFVNHCQRKWRESVGFLPTQVFERYIEAEQLAICEENGLPAGYVNWCGTTKGVTRVIQVAVEPELLRERIGSLLMSMIHNFAIANDQSIIRLTSRVDLFANKFWPTLGFVPTAIYRRPTVRKLQLIEWTKPLIFHDPTTGVTLRSVE